MRPKQVIAALLGLSLAFTTAPAQGQAMMPEQEEIFNMLDTNRDGKLSAAEFVIIWKSPQYGMATFKEWDANRDGFITREEFTRFNPSGELLPTDKER